MTGQIGTAYVEVKGDLTQLQADVASALAPAKLGKVGKVAGVAMGGALAAGVGAAIAGKIAYDLGAEFDKAFDNIRIQTGKTGKPLDKLKKDFKAVFASVPTDAETASDAIAGLNKRLDLTGKPLRNLSKNMLELSRMTETDLGGNIQSLTRLFGDWSVSTGQQVPTLNKLWRASQVTGVGIKDLSDLMVQFGSPLRNLGFDFDTAAAMFSKFEKEGVNIQTAMPGLRMALKNFAADGKEPQKALEQTFRAIDKAGSIAEANTIAFDVFGTRAGPDLAAAIREGRFEFDNIERSMRKGKDTIMRSSRDTRDFGENMTVFGNKLKVIFEPLGTLVFETVGKISKGLAGLPIRKWSNDLQRFVKHNKDFKSVLNAVRNALKVLGVVAGFAWKIMKDQFKAAWGYLKSGLLALKGLVRIVSGVFSGDWEKAWSGVKQLFRGGVGIVLNVMRGLTAPMRAITRLVAKGIAKAFEWGWDKVEGVFSAGADVVIGIIEKMIDVINLIPGVDIEFNTPNIHADPNGASLGRQRGGPIFGGKPTGDSIPAVLERGEYVLNREAVKAVGKDRLDDLNFRKAKRFQKGGPIGMSIGGDAWGAAKDVAGAAVEGASNIPGPIGLAAKAVGKGPDWFIDKLPKPNMPAPFKGLGSWLIKHLTDWIKGKVPKASGPGVLGSASGDIGEAMALAQSMGLQITSGWPVGTPGAHSPTSYHYQPGRAFDASNSSNGSPEQMAYAKAAAAKWGSKILELFYTPLGYSIKNGAVLNDGGFPDHYDHVHTAMQQGGLVGLMRGGPAEHAVVRNVGAFLQNRGFDFRATAGILGNAWREGLWNPSQMEYTGLHNGGLYGFTTSPVSLADMKAFAARRGKSWDDEIVQTNFMLSHGDPTGMAIRGAMNSLETIPETTDYFMRNWERPDLSVSGIDERIGAAYDASSILRNAGIVGPGGAGGGGMTDAEKDARAQKNRIKQRTDYIGRLRKAVADSKGSPLARKGALKRLIKGWSQWGVLDKDARGHITDTVREALGVPNPTGGNSKLQSLASWFREKIDVTGDEDGNDKFSKHLERVMDRADDRSGKKRTRISDRIKKRGLNYPQKDHLLASDRRIAMTEEWINLAMEQANASSGDGGSDYTNAEVDYETRLNKSLLGEQHGRKGLLSNAIEYLLGVRSDFQEKIKAASKPNSPLRWKLSAFTGGLRAANTALGDRRGEMQSLIGLTGRGGSLGATKLRLRELGVTETAEVTSAATRDSDLLALMREQLGLANRTNAILQAQTPIFQQFMPRYHTGGVIPGHSEQPIMAMGGEGVFTPDQMAAMGGGSPTVIIEIAPGAGVDPNMIDARIDGRLVKAVRKVRTGGPAAGRSYVTNG